MSENKAGSIDTLEKVYLSLFIFIPLSWLILFMGWHPLLLFATSAIATIPLARLISEMTERIANNYSSSLGAFVNAAFSNVTEIFISLFAIAAGLIEIVKATIIGSLLANVLFMLGASLFLGGLRFKEQRFNKETIGVASTMLIIAITGFAIPSLLSISLPGESITNVSMVVSAVLIAAYVLGIVFTFFTHKHLFEPVRIYTERKMMQNWGKGRTITTLCIATVLTAIEAHLLVESLMPSIQTVGFTPAFVGVAILGVIGNIPEMTSAFMAAMKNNVNLSIHIAIGSTTQVAMFVVPILVFASVFLGHPLTLVFSLFQIAAVVFAVIIVNYLSADGRCNWLEGVQLLSVYLIIVTAFYYIH